MRRLLVVLILGWWTSAAVQADEGMWLFNGLPKQDLKQKHDFEVTQDWAEHLQLASVRFNSGGSASFISSNGLVLTNHHVAADTLYKLSTAERNLAEDGYYADILEDELKAPDLELNQLVSIEDVTARVDAAVKPEMDAAEASKARQAVMSKIEQESKEKTGLRSDVVTLYGGGRYHLYRYKQYTDVRLVWAPEVQAAMFGGDADNFEYPRYCLDVTIFRVYEEGQPAKIEHFLSVNPDGAQDGDLVFVSGNPGRTQRILTAEALEYQRDHRLPDVLNLLRRKEVLMQQYALEGPEQERRGRDAMLGIQNSRKAYTGMLAGLQNPGFIEQKRSQHRQLQEAIGTEQPWQTIAEVQDRRVELKSRTGSLRGRIYGIAEDLVLMAQEDEKPSPERLREFRDSNRESFEQALFSPAPMYADLERTELADELARFVEIRGGSDPLVAKVLAGKGPRQRAADLIQQTSLFDVEARKKLAKQGLAGIRASDDPLIELAVILNEEYRQLRGISEELDEKERQAYAKITEAKFKAEGDSVYPDATFTLRLAFGPVQGYEEDGQSVPSNTTMGGAFKHQTVHDSEGAWVLPKSWMDAQDSIASSTPFNFVCTADIIGGNSGSPVVDRDGKLVGVIFDGNIQSLTGDFYYTDVQARAVAVHIASVLEALRSIYSATELVQQIGR
ncbi:MAG: S46 family peptidase [bacterium]|nr:S46 family peptidase [bacterium]